MKISISAAEEGEEGEEEENKTKTALDQEQDARIRNCLQRMSNSHAYRRYCYLTNQYKTNITQFDEHGDSLSLNL
jgi:predicted transcriptional regulator of viral defense system